MKIEIYDTDEIIDVIEESVVNEKKDYVTTVQKEIDSRK